jgi:ISXO2-like transposase domain
MGFGSYQTAWVWMHKPRRTYRQLTDHGFQHQPVNLVGSGKRAHQLFPRVHRVAALLKRWLAGTLHHGINHSHLDYYLDEFTFRFNRRTSRGLLFYRLLEQAVQTEPHPYRSLVSTEGDLTWPIRQRPPQSDRPYKCSVCRSVVVC